MTRPRNVLLTYFSPGRISTEQASDALRKSNGDLERAKALLEESLKFKNTTTATAKDDRVSLRTVAEDTTKTASSSTAIVSILQQQQLQRVPPRSIASINNLSDRQYCCVWHVEVFEDGHRPQVARALLARVARHVNPILRHRGWGVKRLMESASKQWIGCCTGNGRNDADAASTNIQLNLRVEPNKHCQQFRTFEQVMSVMLHEITHTSIGLEDIHPPAFYELLNEIRQDYRSFLQNGKVAEETDDYGCNDTFVMQSGQVSTVGQAASNMVQAHGGADIALFDSHDECGATNKQRRRGGKKRAMKTVACQEKRRPLLKGAKMIDKRTKLGKAVMAERASISPREFAARAALARFGNGKNAIEEARKEEDSVVGNNENEEEVWSEEDNDNDDSIALHDEGCTCRSCEWEKMLESSLKPGVSSLGDGKKSLKGED